MGILPQLILNSIIAGAIYTMVALGFNLIYSTVKFFDLSYGVMTAIATRAYVLDKGQVVVTGEPQDLLQRGILEKVFLGQPLAVA